MAQSLKQTLWYGLRGRCPCCGEGKLFRSFLKVADQCPQCGEEFAHHRADDLPAYLVILILGHLFVPLALEVEVIFSPPLWVHVIIWTPLMVAAALAMLQPVKGAVVALQWHYGMHGFKEAKSLRDAAQAVQSGAE